MSERDASETILTFDAIILMLNPLIQQLESFDIGLLKSKVI